MARTALEDRGQILDELATAVDQLALAVACLSEAFELLAVDAADRLEAELYRPVHKAFGRAQRTHTKFAERFALPRREFGLPSPGRSSQGVGAFVERAVTASTEADRTIAELQDSMLPIESGDAELRTGLSDVRDLLDGVPASARQFLRTLGR
jgi:hypothetical protein